jgi:Raf kinase inhibitor-like YbhB/YbcL family protein
MENQITLRSAAFGQGEKIPVRFTCDGDDINPELQIENLPGNTRSLALIIDDPDAPNGTWTHWLVWNINVTGKIAENSIPGTEGKNDFGKLHYGGPCPPGGTHRYFFRVYALRQELQLPEGSSKEELLAALKPYLLGVGELMGKYSRR